MKSSLLVVHRDHTTFITSCSVDVVDDKHFLMVNPFFAPTLRICSPPWINFTWLIFGICIVQCCLCGWHAHEWVLDLVITQTIQAPDPLQTHQSL